MKKQYLPIILALVLVLTMSTSLVPKDKAAEKLAKAEKQLTDLLGTDTNWKATIFKDLRKNMPCSTVKKYFKGLRCNPAKKYDFPKVSGKLFGKVKEYQFTFKSGKLQSATIIFGVRAFDEKRFTTALLNVAQRKWGKLSPEKLNKTVKTWINGDYDTVTMSKSRSNWQLKIAMPKRDTGDVTAGSMNTEDMKNNLLKLLGSNKTWTTPSSGKFKRGDSCAAVSKAYSAMKGCNPAKSWSFGTVTIKNHPLVHALKFSFKQGGLYSVTYIFHRQLPKEEFKKVSLAVFEYKWGKVKPGKRDQDILTIYKSKFGSAQRSFSLDHWQIKHDFPK
ncbi:MAG: hypothetical protein GY950_36550 [bacterium]|nr:hypothetical protein [bacterium]